MTILRLVQKTDLQALLTLYTYLGDNPIPQDRDKLACCWQTLLSDERTSIILAQTADQVVSTCTLTVILNLTHDLRPYGFIENGVTLPASRKQGLAGQCLAEAVRIAQAQNCYKVVLTTGSKRPETLNFYRNAGFNDSDKTAFVRWL